ncbi:metal ABC transporter ATP-binding protein [Methylobrevis albus]|uniref:ABC transporter ATP-binding protein n=1 Tax=Methylobrevis albus TaxID=2793297 RepID=A0A931I318_9HYPH|nr:ABC transporter ATP-binding protein [Methylobrevis albus]MBH0239327.1 ABC transporter ATP-binding protein [Methylobrevis albus]
MKLHNATSARPVRPAGVRFENATIGYERHPAVHHIDGRIEPGALMAVVGPNGAGKSTLLKAIVGALPPYGGRIVLEGIKARDVAYLPQQAEIDRSFPIPVFDFVAMGLWKSCGLFGGFARSRTAEVSDVLAAVGLSGFERRSLDTLSGGQMQRVLFARLLLQDAPLILLDEPFTAIDSRTARDLMDLVLRWHGEGRTVVAVLHDLEMVRQSFPESILLARRVVAWGPTGEVLAPANLNDARRMPEAWDEHAPLCDDHGAEPHVHPHGNPPGAGRPAEHGHDHHHHHHHDGHDHAHGPAAAGTVPAERAVRVGARAS